jgi:mono/diheme cytochrome c family protein
VTELCKSLGAALLAGGLLLSAGCQQKMARQPSYRPLQGSDFFPDGRASRPLVPGTVARGQLDDNPHLYTGKKGPGESPADYYSTFPGTLFPTGDDPERADKLRALLERGRERFNIYCAVCHDRGGGGNGMIVQRGFPRPPSYHDDYSRGFRFRNVKVPLPEAPVGYYFQVITRGYGAMPSYAEQVSVPDRWKIIAHIRVLQQSQSTPEGDLTPEDRKELDQPRKLTGGSH